jgi:DNA-binding transcriptional ArsR family regulator
MMNKKKDSVISQAAGLYRLLSHPGRLQILDELRCGEACVCHLQAMMKRPQAYVSQQLRVLREAEVLDTYKDGLNVYYRIVSEPVLELLEVTLGPAAEMRPVRYCPCPKCASGNCTTDEIPGE